MLGLVQYVEVEEIGFQDLREGSCRVGVDAKRARRDRFSGSVDAEAKRERRLRV